MTAAVFAPLDGLKTLTGESLIGALQALDQKLPDGAYKAVAIGSRRFTDISPAYSTEEIGNHFGPLGIGWGYEVEEELTEKVGDTWSVTLRCKVWYRYAVTDVAYDGIEAMPRIEWQAYGGNANAAAKADRHFCWQGALTNAIGKGWSLQGFQRTIYKGEDFTIEDAPASPPAPRGDTNARSATTDAATGYIAEFAAFKAAAKKNGTGAKVKEKLDEWKMPSPLTAEAYRDMEADGRQELDAIAGIQ